jgi:RecJ-like exonuclease
MKIIKITEEIFPEECSICNGSGTIVDYEDKWECPACKGTGLSNPPKENIEEQIKNNTSSDIICPFCKEGDFDLIGLKSHLEHGDCEKYNSIKNLPKLM